MVCCMSLQVELAHWLGEVPLYSQLPVHVIRQKPPFWPKAFVAEVKFWLKLRASLETPPPQETTLRYWLSCVAFGSMSNPTTQHLGHWCIQCISLHLRISLGSGVLYCIVFMCIFCFICSPFDLMSGCLAVPNFARSFPANPWWPSQSDVLRRPAGESNSCQNDIYGSNIREN